MFCHAAFDVAGDPDVQNMRAAGDDVGVVAAFLHWGERNTRMWSCLDAGSNGCGTGLCGRVGNRRFFDFAPFGRSAQNDIVMGMGMGGGGVSGAGSIP